MRTGKVIVVMPAFNAGRTLEKIFRQIPKGLVSEVIMVDDGSEDNTVILAKKLRIKTLVHPKNLGYGANQKTCYQNALKMGAKYVIMLHPDGQYDPKDLPKFIDALKGSQADLVLGSRFLGSGFKNTPFYKQISLRLITYLFNLFLGLKLTEVNSGYRGFTSDLLKKIPFEKNGNGYIFDPQLLIQAKYFGFKIKEVPVSKIYNEEAISPNFLKSVHHGLENLYLLAQYLLQRFKIAKISFLTV